MAKASLAKAAKAGAHQLSEAWQLFNQRMAKLSYPSE